VFQLLTTALSALAGGFMGAYFTRQAQHHKWLLERRAEAFAKFLQMIDDAHSSASNILYDKKIENPERDIKVLEVYRPVLNYARIVRLYLPRTLRQEFSERSKKYWALHTDPDLGSSRLNKMSEHLDRIQEIFEQELSAYFWLRPIERGWIYLRSHLGRKLEKKDLKGASETFPD
jgi:hypothetical protein